MPSLLLKMIQVLARNRSSQGHSVVRCLRSDMVNGGVTAPTFGWFRAVTPIRMLVQARAKGTLGDPHDLKKGGNYLKTANYGP